MNVKTIALLACVSGCLLGCTTSANPVAATATAANAPPVLTQYRSFRIEPNRETPERSLSGQTCRLSATKSCLDLDPRPFAPCLISASTCDQKGAEPMQVAPLVYIEPYAIKSR